jgi:hypothetical protein
MFEVDDTIYNREIEVLKQSESGIEQPNLPSMRVT